MFVFAVAGTTFESRQEKIAALHKAEGPIKIVLTAEPDNKFDANAIAVYANDVHIGYVPRTLTSKVSAMLPTHEARLYALVGGSPDYPTLGARILLDKPLEADNMRVSSKVWSDIGDDDQGDDPYGYGFGGPIDADDLP